MKAAPRLTSLQTMARSHTAILCLLLLLTGSLKLHAQYTWSATPLSGTMSNDSNWTGGSAPVSGSSWVFGSSNTYALTNNFSGYSVGGITFQNGAGAYTISGSALTLTGDIINSSTVTQTINTALTINSSVQIVNNVNSSSSYVKLGGALSGTGTIIFSATSALSRLQLTGVNTNFAGNLIANSGRVDIGQNSTSALANYTFNTSGGVNFTVGNVIYQLGSLSGSTNLAAGGSSYTNFTVEMGANVASGSSTTFSGNIGGTNPGSYGVFNISKTGSGTQILTGSNTYSQSTTIKQGILQLGSGGTTGSISSSTNIVINDGGYFSINQSRAVTQGTQFTANAISGSGGFIQAGSGTTTLSSTNTYSGETQVNAGALRLTHGQAIQNSVLNIGAGTLQFDNTVTSATFGGLKGSTNFTPTNLGGGAVNITLNSTAGISSTYSGILGGGISLTISGSGTQIFSGNNSYSGATALNSGTLQIGDGGAAGALSTSSTITNNGALVFNRSNTVTQGTHFSASAIEGTGSLTQSGSGTLVLSSSNSYSGGTILVNGTVAINNANSLGAASGALTFAGASTLRADASLTTSRSYTLNAAATIDTNGNDLANNGVLSGTGTLTKAGVGTLALNGTSTYSGATTINAGVLEIGGSGQLGSSGSYSGAIANAGTLRMNTSANQTLAGILSGTGSLTQSGGGALILTASNSYTGATTISGGTLQIGNGGTSGALSTSSSITNNGSLVFNRSNTLVQGTDFSASAISGTGSLTQSGSGTLTLTAANSYTGATVVGSGTLQIGDGGAAGALSTSSTITNNGALVFNRSDTVTQGTHFSASAIEGTGSLTQSGSGTLVLSGSNSYSGGTILANGTLAINNANSLGASSGALTFSRASTLRADATLTTARNYVLNAAAAVDTNGYDLTSNGVLSGTGALTKSGNGTLSLGGTNSYTGATTISAGVFEIGGAGQLGSTGTYAGAIANSSSLRFATSANQTLSGNISGSGNLAKSGAGTLILSGSNSYTGKTTVNGGTLSIATYDYRLGSAPASFFADQLTLNGGTLAITGVLSWSANRGITLGANGGAIDIASSVSQLITTGSIISGGAGSGALTKAGAGTLQLGNNSYAGGFNLNNGTLVVYANYTSTNGLVTASPVGTGTMTINGGRIAPQGGTGNQLGANKIVVNGDFAIALPTGGAAYALTLAAPIDLTGSTRTVSLGRFTTASLVMAGTVPLKFSAFTGQSTTIGSGTLRFVRESSGGDADFTGVNFSTGYSYTEGAGLTIGDHVITYISVSSPFNAANAVDLPRLHVEAGGYFNLSDTATARSVQIRTLSGSGVVTSLANAAASGTSTLTINAQNTDNATFSGGIVDGNSLNASLGTSATNVALALTKTGSGTQILSGSNSYSGATTVSAGTLALSGSGTLGNSQSAVLVNGGNLDLGGLSRTNGSLTISSGTLTNGTLTAATYALNGGRVAADLGNGTLNVGGNSTLSGYAAAASVNITSGTLTLGASNRLNNSANVSLSSGLNLGAYSQTLSGLTGSGTVSNTVGSVLTVSRGLGTTGTFNGAIRGTGGFVKSGEGKFVLTGSNNQITSTMVEAGLLTVNGKLDSAISVKSGGSLGGSGTVGNVIIQSGGVLAPGNSPGTLTTGTLSLLGGGSFTLELASDGSGTPGQQWDQTVASTLSLSALSEATPFTLKLTTLDLNYDPNPLAQFDKTVNHTWSSILSYTSLDGVFNSKHFFIDTTGFQNNYIGTFTVVQNGSAIDLQYLAVPEPSSFVSLLGGFGFLLLFKRGRHRKS